MGLSWPPSPGLRLFFEKRLKIFVKKSDHRWQSVICRRGQSQGQFLQNRAFRQVGACLNTALHARRGAPGSHRTARRAHLLDARQPVRAMPEFSGIVDLTGGSDDQAAVPTLLPIRRKKTIRASSKTPSPQSDQLPPPKRPKVSSEMMAVPTQPPLPTSSTSEGQAQLATQRASECMLRAQQIILQRQQQLLRQQQAASAASASASATPAASPLAAVPQLPRDTPGQPAGPSGDGETSPSSLDALLKLQMSALKTRMKRAGVPQRLQDSVSHDSQPKKLAANLVRRYEAKQVRAQAGPGPCAPATAAPATTAVARAGAMIGQRHQQAAAQQQKPGTEAGACLCTLCFSSISGHEVWPHPLLRVAVCKSHFDELCDAVDRAKVSERHE